MHSNADFMTVDDAADLVGCSHWTIRRWLELGKLTRYKALSRTMVSRYELLALLEPKKRTNHGQDHRRN
jgi:excisionase family DNA binding protein